MTTLTIDAKELDKLRKQIDGFSDRRMRAAVATALTRTAIKARDEAKSEMLRTIDKPTAYTTRQLRYIMAKADKLVTAVGFNISPIQDVHGKVVRYEDMGAGQTPAGKYMTPNIQGGGRGTKRFELALQATGAMPKNMYAVPGPGAKLDANGNVSRAQIAQIISQVGTELTAGHNRSLRQRPGESKQSFQTRMRNAFGRAGGRYFAVPKQTQRLRPGVYLATGRNFGSKIGYGVSGSIVPVLWFVSKVSYRARYRLDDVIHKTFREEFNIELQRAFDEHVKRLSSSAK